MPVGAEVTVPLPGPSSPVRSFGFVCPSTVTDSVYCGGGGAGGGSSGAGGGVPGFVEGGSGDGGVPLPGGGRPGVEGVDGGTEAEPREYEIVPSGSTHLIRQDPLRARNRVRM